MVRVECKLFQCRVYVVVDSVARALAGPHALRTDQIDRRAGASFAGAKFSSRNPVVRESTLPFTSANASFEA